MVSISRASVVAAALLLVPAVGARAQDPLNGGAVEAARGATEPQNTYGTTDYSNYTIVAHSFNPRSGDSTLYASGGFLRNRTGGDAFMIAEVQLPSGAQVLGSELEGCDEAAVGEISTWLVACPIPAGTCVLHAGGGTTGTPGCVTSFAAFPAPVVVNNETNTYFVQMTLGSTTTQTRFRAVRLRYQLQVSPAPGVATFGDVPVGHPQHRFVEALVDAGITSGCGGGNYCPNDAVTRGQMAVFLSVALGLHFPH